MAGHSLINIGELSRPATVLIEKVSNAVGTVWEPRQIRRVAQAKADAALILAEGEIEITDLQRRAAQRFVDEETRNQSNMESITEQAIPQLNPDAPVENMADDWIANFFDKCRIVSDEDMQNLWSRILAGEANSPSSFSRKTVNMLADMDKSDAELFANLCCFGWWINGMLAPLIFDPNDPIHHKYGINTYSLGQLNSIGFIQTGSLGFSISERPQRITASYFGRPVNITFPAATGNKLKIGSVFLTPYGQQLSRIVETAPVDGFFEFVYDRWSEQSLVPPRTRPTQAPGG